MPPDQRFNCHATSRKNLAATILDVLFAVWHVPYTSSSANRGGWVSRPVGVGWVGTYVVSLFPLWKGNGKVGWASVAHSKRGEKGVDRPHSLPLPLAKGDGDPTQPFHSGNPHTHPPTISPIPCHEGKRGGDTVDDPCPTLTHRFPFLPGMENNGSVTCPHSPFSSLLPDDCAFLWRK